MTTSDPVENDVMYGETSVQAVNAHQAVRSDADVNYNTDVDKHGAIKHAATHVYIYIYLYISMSTRFFQVRSCRFETTIYLRALR